MTLILTLKVFCKSNLFVFEGHANGINTDQVQEQYHNKL